MINTGSMYGCGILMLSGIAFVLLAAEIDNQLVLPAIVATAIYAVISILWYRSVQAERAIPRKEGMK